ncbi:hypothetical protein RF55_10743 [Lasius niger]|uniref:Uncharacterized protein n=1 Tax=Lasius niger TaxID=67767 RepID=A0A0J7KHD1_LASNI|nr:hypothetical protein RF55_10743 [Lasius niger]
MLREQETRSGVGKPTRPKCFLFESLNFLEKHMVHRKSITNMSFSQPSTSMMHQANKGINQDEDFRVREEMTSPQVISQRSFSQNKSMISKNNISALERPWTSSPLQHQSQLSDSMVKQVDNLIPAPTHMPDTQPALVSINTVTAFDCFNTAINYFTIRAISCFITTATNYFTIRAISCFIITAINCFPLAPIDYFQFSAIYALRFRF